MPDRRDPRRQEPKIHGRRISDPTLTTRLCADRLGVSTDFIVGEIRDGRLRAHVRIVPGKRAIYRISEAEFRAYQSRHWRQQLPAQPLKPTEPPGHLDS